MDVEFLLISCPLQMGTCFSTPSRVGHDGRGDDAGGVCGGDAAGDHFV